MTGRCGKCTAPGDPGRIICRTCLATITAGTPHPLTDYPPTATGPDRPEVIDCPTCGQPIAAHMAMCRACADHLAATMRGAL